MSSAVNQSSSAQQQSQQPSAGHHHHHHHHKHHASDDAPAIERFGKLRHSPREKVGAKAEQVAPVEHEHHHHHRHHHHHEQQELGHHHHRHPNAFPSAESLNLSPDQEAFLKDASYARGGSLANHLRADYDLHHRCSLPPMQARFEASLIYMPVPNDRLTRGGGEADEAKAPVGVSITAASGQQAQLQRQPASDQHPLQPLLSTYHHPNENVYYSAASKTVSNDDERLKEHHHHHHRHALHDAPGAPSSFFYHTDFYNLGADYDIHKSCLLPNSEAKFGESFIHMPDWDMTRQLLRELRDQYPHLHL